MDRIGEILSIIDRALAEDLTGKYPECQVAQIETQVWADLNESVDAGWQTLEQAQYQYDRWRQNYLSLGPEPIDPYQY